MNNNRNVILAVILSSLVLFGWQYFVAVPQMKQGQAHQTAIAQKTAKPQGEVKAPDVPAAPTAAPTPQNPPKALSRHAALKQGGARVAIETPTVDGSLRLQGARFDDLRLRKYRESVDPGSKEIELLSPSNSAYPYFVQMGWSAAGNNADLPDDKTPWQLASGGKLAPNKPIVLRWDNGHGLIFTRKIEIDERYMFTVTDSVSNKSGAARTLYPYALVARDGVPEHMAFWVLHEGFVGVADGSLKDATYDDFKDDDKEPQKLSSKGGWLGITDKYWMAALIPPQNEKYDGMFRSSPYGESKSYQANYTLQPRAVAPGQTVSVTHHLFAGAKVVDTLNDYEDKLGIQRFDLAVDWGWFIFLTKPLFWLLDWLNKYLGNFGLAIIVATVLIRLALYPLADASFKSMIKMKKVQPEMERLKKQCEGDQQKLQQEMMELYKREKVNPLSGCLPMIVQIPILFSLYKVMFVTIEMYHAPFFGWIKDLSAADPTSYLNLFGLLPFTVPNPLPWGLAFLGFLVHVGIWPILMGITQWIQTQLNPAPADPIQAKVFGWMPWIFMFMMATFPAGLVIYWTWNNLLSVGQQYLMMRRENVPVHLFENLKLAALARRLTKGGKTE